MLSIFNHRAHNLHAALRAPLLGMVLLGFIAMSPSLAQAKGLADWAITFAVEQEMSHDPAVPLNLITVRTNHGIVTLRGNVSNLLAKQRAITLTKTVKGVRSVIDQLRVVPILVRTDAQLVKDVDRALLRDPAVKSWKIVPRASTGTVTLTGTVHSWAQKQLAAKVAEGVDGVTALKNNIAVRYSEKRSDLQIKHEVNKRLRWDALVDHRLIKTRVQNGKVTLNGIVGSAAERFRASVDAWVMGVMAVDTSGLTVRKWASDSLQRKHTIPILDDQKVEDALKTALSYDPRVFSFDVDVHVQNGIVTLRGRVDNLAAKRAAEREARNTVGVLRVHNRLKVRTAVVSDATLKKEIEAALTQDPWVEAPEVKVRVQGGHAYLDGEVDSYFEKVRADTVAAKVWGVKEVTNRLRVTDGAAITYNPYIDDLYFYNFDWYDYQPRPTYKTDERIKADIKAELFWDPYVFSTNVGVKVNNGVATLTGKVHDLRAWAAALKEAYEGGATWVYNHLKVK